MDNLPRDVLGIITDNLTPEERFLLSGTCRKLRTPPRHAPDELMLYAARGAHWSLLRWALVRSYPCPKKVPILAAAAGRLDLLQELRTAAYHVGACEVFLGAVGHIPVLRWLMVTYPWEKFSKVLLVAAAATDPRTFHWVYARVTPLDASADRHLCLAAASAGNLGALRTIAGDYYRRHANSPGDENNCGPSLAQKSPPFTKQIAEEMIREAAGGGHRSVVEWLCEFGYRDMWLAFPPAIQRGDLALLQWMWERSKPEPAAYPLCKEALFADSIPVLEWIRSIKRISVDINDLIVHYGTPSAVRWFRTKGHVLPLNTTATAIAARHGRAEMLRFLLEEGYPWDPETIDYHFFTTTRKEAQIAVLEVLFGGGYPVSGQQWGRASRIVQSWAESRGYLPEGYVRMTLPTTGNPISATVPH